MSKVLIVDDTTFMRTMIRNILEKEGIEVVGEARDGSEAIAKYLDTKPDVVTMDITMPVLSGLEALKIIRQHDHNAKVVMVTAIDQQGVLKEALQYGAESYVVKPFVAQHIVDTIRSVVNHA